MTRTGHTHPLTSRPPIRQRSPESSPPSPGGPSSAANRRAACQPAGAFLAAFAALLVLALAALATPAAAQTTVTLISNVGQTAVEGSYHCRPSTGLHDREQLWRIYALQRRPRLGGRGN